MFFRAELTDWLKENGDCKRVRHFQKYQKTFDRAMDKSDKIGFRELQKNATRQRLLDAVIFLKIQ